MSRITYLSNGQEKVVFGNVYDEGQFIRVETIHNSYSPPQQTSINKVYVVTIQD
jgi:hypothetical protein